MLNILEQEFKSKYKNEFGEVHTDYKLIEQMLNIIPPKIFKDPQKTWLDPACGKGYFMILIFNRLYKSLTTIDKKNRKEHIIKNMLFMVEKNPVNTEHLYKIFGNDANIYNID